MDLKERSKSSHNLQNNLFGYFGFEGFSSSVDGFLFSSFMQINQLKNYFL
jgi:hypothetical protein